MRYVILGAGAIGAAIGGRLADSGCDVILVGRGQHAETVQREGLKLAMPDRLVVLRVPMLTLAELRLTADDALIIAVKSQDTARLLEQLSAVAVDGWLSDLPVFCAQNGLANEETALRFFARVFGVCVNVPATHLEPGVVAVSGTPVSGALQLGRFPAGTDDLSRAVAGDLQRSGFHADLRADVMAWKRTKLISNLANALQVLCASGNHASDGASPVRAVTSRLAAEATACYEAAGLPAVDRATFRAEAGGFQIVAVPGQPRPGGSTWQSVARGLPSVETDFLNGEIVRLGRLHDVPTPVNAAVQARMRDVMLGLLEPGTLAPSDLLPESAAATA